jgi:hypothetical protein
MLLAGFCVAATAAPWQPLLEDHSAKAWSGWKSPGLPAGWRVNGGVLSKDGAVEDLVTNQMYGNFELELEWKIGKAGNSGIFYRGTREYDHIYWSGPEYQLLDDANAEDGASRLTAAASAYALYGAPAGIVAYDLKSADWKSRVAASKFSAYPHYGLADKGMIGIQGDHPGTLAIRRIRVRELP